MPATGQIEAMSERAFSTGLHSHVDLLCGYMFLLIPRIVSAFMFRSLAGIHSVPKVL
jgi:hypothetical protein